MQTNLGIDFLTSRPDAFSIRPSLPIGAISSRPVSGAGRDRNTGANNITGNTNHGNDTMEPEMQVRGDRLHPIRAHGSVGFDQASTSVFALLKENDTGFRAIWQPLDFVWYRFQGQRAVMGILWGAGSFSSSISSTCVVSIAVSGARAIWNIGFCGDRNGLEKRASSHHRRRSWRNKSKDRCIRARHWRAELDFTSHASRSRSPGCCR